MDILIQAAQFILSLSLLIVLHEAGHFLPAKLFKTRVEKFYLFFDPWFSLVKKKVGETEYGIGWLPLGGYVKIAGMIDESMDKEQLASEPQPWEFRSKPAWQRLIIMVGGVTVNVILAIFIYSGMMMYYGETYLPVEKIDNGLMYSEAAQDMGLQNGDLVLAVDGEPIERYSDIPKELLLSEESITIRRAGQQKELPVSSSDKKGLIQAQRGMLSLRMPYVVGAFTDSSLAQQAGLQKGDSIVALNGTELRYFDQFTERIPEFAGDSVTLGLYRAGQYQELTTAVSDSGKLGVYAGGVNPRSLYQVETRKYGFFASFPAGLGKAKTVLQDYIRQFGLIFNAETEAYKEVGGFLTIGSQFDTSWNWQRFWNFTAFLSIMLAFLNILPIPALDGGHVVFVLWEMISGRKPPQKVLEYAQMVGFIILLALIVLANGNDILKLF
ncbi:MAG: RIP metalloprotease RseP [Schleiferiaceae bacterium]|nr:RIP metalloprotease RseP [Schleiferiaceae bacterium]